MRDFLVLRDALRAALLFTPIAAVAACGPSTAPPPDDPISNETDDPGDPPPVAEVPWPVAQGGCGDGGEFCAPVQQVTAYVSQPVENGCPDNFDREGLYFNRNPDAPQTQADPSTCCYYYSDGCVIGRPLLDAGEVKVATVRDGGAWARRRDGGGPERNESLAQAWLADALLEHASVASFARATLELMALGAPPDLLADCQRAGLDEVRHAELCFGLVERYLGRRVAPGPIAALPAREADFARLAVDTFVEGCVAETVATLAATRLRAACTDDEVAAVLDRVIRDETRHAALAWRTIAWTVAQGGDRVRAALREVAAAIAPGPAVAGVDDVRDEALLAHGRLDGRTRRAAQVDAWREIIAPTLTEILA